jgi:hypothetical protein
MLNMRKTHILSAWSGVPGRVQTSVRVMTREKTKKGQQVEMFVLREAQGNECDDGDDGHKEKEVCWACM